MIAVLCSLDDTPALQLSRALAALGAPCRVVTPELLSFARRRSVRLDDTGMRSVVELADGTTLDSGKLSGVVNRMLHAPDVAWSRAAAGERDYARAELHAWATSWLTGLPCPVRNRPSPTCLAGPAPHPAVAVAAAATAGLFVAPLRLGDRTPDSPHAPVLEAAWRVSGPHGRHVPVACLDGEPLRAVPEAVRAALGPFAAGVDAGEALVGVDFVVDGEAWWFAGLTTVPEFDADDLAPRLLALFGTRGAES